jgi:hypothetical protein
MKFSELIKALGRRAVAARCGVGENAVSNWVARGEVPAEHRISLWHLALEAGLDWTPPGAEALRDKLRETLPARVA